MPHARVAESIRLRCQPAHCPIHLSEVPGFVSTASTRKFGSTSVRSQAWLPSRGPISKPNLRLDAARQSVRCALLVPLSYACQSLPRRTARSSSDQVTPLPHSDGRALSASHAWPLHGTSRPPPAASARMNGHAVRLHVSGNAYVLDRTSWQGAMVYRWFPSVDKVKTRKVLDLASDVTLDFSGACGANAEVVGQARKLL